MYGWFRSSALSISSLLAVTVSLIHAGTEPSWIRAANLLSEVTIFSPCLYDAPKLLRDVNIATGQVLSPDSDL